MEIKLTKPLCKNKLCKKGKSGKRLKFQQVRVGELFCCPDCLIEYIQSKDYKNANEKAIRLKNAKDKKVMLEKWGATAYLKENKKTLQDEINKLAKKIDAKFGYDTCIDCGKHISTETHQIDSCHLISRKKNGGLRYHLANLHSGHNHCNTKNENHESAYKLGIKNRYGIKYLEMVENLPLEYPLIQMKAQDYVDKIKVVRKLNREIEKMNFIDSIDARNKLNIIVGIYTKNFN